MKNYLFAILISTLLAGTALPVLAADNHDHMAAVQNSHQVKGEVTAVDQAGSRLQLKHGAVPELKWPAMTMYFAVADKTQLNGLKVGDKVEVTFMPQPGSAPLISRITRVK